MSAIDTRAKTKIYLRTYKCVIVIGCYHGVDLGQAYKTCESAHKFVHYVAESQRQAMLSGCLSVKHFFSCLMDGSTDKGKVEIDLFVILYCHKDSNTEEVKTTVKFLSVVEPMKADADGLISCLNDALKPMGIDDILDSEDALLSKGIQFWLKLTVMEQQ